MPAMAAHTTIEEAKSVLSPRRLHSELMTKSAARNPSAIIMP